MSIDIVAGMDPDKIQVAVTKFIKIMREKWNGPRFGKEVGMDTGPEPNRVKR